MIIFKGFIEVFVSKLISDFIRIKKYDGLGVRVRQDVTFDRE